METAACAATGGQPGSAGWLTMPMDTTAPAVADTATGPAVLATPAGFAASLMAASLMAACWLVRCLPPTARPAPAS